MQKLILAAILLAGAAFGQNCSMGAPLNSTACTQILTYDGSNNLLYACRARSIQPSNSILSISAGSNANPVSLTVTGHGFNTNQLPLVTISGGTGNWAAVNGTWTATITGANTLTVPVNSTSFGAVTGTLILTTYAPRTTQSVWSVMKLVYDGSNNLVNVFYPGGSTSERNTCSAGPSQYQ